MHESDLAEDPVVQLRTWLDEGGSTLDGSTPMALATADETGRPSVRVVLLRCLDGRGLTFFTNRESRKGRDLRRNPRAAAVLHWPELGRQVRVEGTVEETSAEESRAYWESRPRGSRIAAWASPQSQRLAGREELEARVADAASRFAGCNVPLPEHWGGYRIVPDAVEFWTHRDDRLHDRVLYRLEGGGWRRERLAP